MAKKRASRETLSKKRDPRVDSEPPPPSPPARASTPARSSNSGRPSTPARRTQSSPTVRERVPAPTSSTSAERREIRASSPTPPDRQSARSTNSPSVSSSRPSDAPPRLVPERVLSARPGPGTSPARITVLEDELAKERVERAAEADTIAEMLVRVTTLESRAKSAEAALAQAERDGETKLRAAKEQGGGLARKIEDAEGRVAELESELRTFKTKAAAAEKSSDRARASEERNLELLDRVSSLQAELNSAEQVAADLQVKHEELEAKHHALLETHGSAAATHAVTEEDLVTAQQKLAAADERRKELEESVSAADDKVRKLVAERTLMEQEHAAFFEKHEETLKEHAALGTKHAAIEKELVTTREHYDKALAEARRTEATRVAALEAKNEDTKKVLEGKLDETKKSLAAEQKSHAELRAVLEAVQTEAATTSAKLTEVSQERDRVSSAMTSLAERVGVLETRETTLFGQLGVATTAFQRATAIFDELESRETENAVRRTQDYASLRESLRTSFAGLPSKRSLRRSTAPSAGHVEDVTADAELIASMHPPRRNPTPPDLEAEGWDAGNDTGEASETNDPGEKK